VDPVWIGLMILKNFADRTGLDSNYQIRTGTGLKNFTVCSSLIFYSVANGPASWSWSNRILQIRTGPGLDWIFEKLNRNRFGYPNCIDHCSV